MPDSVHVPILGNMNKGTAIAGIGALVVVGGYELYRRSKKKAAATAATAQSTAYGYGAYGYGTGAYGYGGADLQNGFYGYGFGPSGLGAYNGQSFTPYGYGYYGAGVTGQQVATQATTNAQWTQAAVTALTGQAGYSTSDVLAALGQYLLGHPLTAAQSQIVDSAIAAEGYPPNPPPTPSPVAQQPGQNGDGDKDGSGGGTHPANNVKVPNVVGQWQSAAFAIIKAAGLNPSGQKVVVGKVRVVYAQTPTAGSIVPRGTTVTVETKVT